MMKRRFCSIWFRIVVSFFWIMVATCALMGFFAYFIARYSLPLAGIHLFSLFALVSVVFGSIISMFALHHVLNPITELSRAMQKVANGDYSVRLNVHAAHPMDEMYDLHCNFNQMAQMLDNTEMLRADFVANVSHEFKTPLSAISGYATLLQDDTLTPEERSEYISTIIHSTKELSRMTSNILSLSFLENQTDISEKEPFRVDEQIRQSILRMEPSWSEKNISLNPELDNITWYGNMELSAHIWNNLLDNAIKFTPVGGAIDVSAHICGACLTVVFCDSGIGMTPEVQAHIFDKFYQGDASHKKKGNGLGLALVRRIVTLYGGTIEVESGPELGSTFTIRLPLASEAPP